MTGSQQNSQSFDASAWRVAIVAARFNAVLVDQLVEGATGAWRAHGGKASELLVVRVRALRARGRLKKALEGSK